MTLRKPVVTSFAGDCRGDRTLVQITWSPVLLGDTCAPSSFAHWADRSIEVGGTFTNGAAISLNGSNSGQYYAALNDVTKTPISITSMQVVQVLELTCYAQPILMGGDSNTNLTITMACRRPQNLLPIGP